MIVKNGYVFTETGTFEQKELYILGDRIVDSKEDLTDQTVIDARGCKIIPGLVDVHSHGAAGCDFGD